MTNQIGLLFGLIIWMHEAMIQYLILKEPTSRGSMIEISSYGNPYNVNKYSSKALNFMPAFKIIASQIDVTQFLLEMLIICYRSY